MPESLTTGAPLAAGTLALAVALLLGPGWLMLRLVGIRGLLAIALAPACSTAVLGVAAILAGVLGVGWGAVAALAGVALGVAAALVVRVLAAPPPPPEGVGRAELVAIGAGLLLAVLPVAVGAGSVDAYLQRWDGVFHLAALQQIEETGSASSLTLGSLSYGDGRAAIYPAGWHALASLLPGSPSAVLNLGASVTAALPWVLGCAVLAIELARGRDRAGVAGTAGLLAGIASATPMSLWVGWGHVPNAAGLAMLPAAVALGLRLVREPQGRVAGVVALLVALLGMGLAHPNATLAAAALLLPALVGAVVASVRRSLAHGRPVRAVAVPMLAVGGAAALVTAFLLSPLAAAVLGYTGGSTDSIVDAIVDVVTGQYRLWSSATGIAIGVIALAGAIVCGVRRQWLPPAMLGLSWLLYVDAATGGHLYLSGLWYTSPARLSVLVSAVAVPLAAVTLVAAAAWWRRRAGVLAPAVVAAVLALALTIPSVTFRAQRTAPIYEPEPGNPPQFVTSAELAMIPTLPRDGVTLGSPFSGASSAYGLVGLPVVFPVAGQVWSADQQLVMDNLDDLAAGTAAPEVCDAVERLGIRYLYQDGEPYQEDHRYEPLDRLQVTGATLVAEADTARFWRLPPCDE